MIFIFNIKNKKISIISKIITKNNIKNTKIEKLEQTHNFIRPSQLNDIKMKIYSDINSNKKFLKEYYNVCKMN